MPEKGPRVTGGRAIVFDYGGVLARWPEPSDFSPVAEEIGLTWQMYREGFAKYRRAYDGGEISCREMYARILADNALAAADSALVRLVRADDESWTHPVPETLAWMKELKAAGFRIGILTNMAASYFRDWFSRFFAEHVALADALVVSGVEGITKPDPAIYRLMERRLGLTPQELVFMDDMPGNVAAARSLGWSAFRFTTCDAARIELERILSDGIKES
jgi:epoxide hydrolase-like predicted phosphatase